VRKGRGRGANFGWRPVSRGNRRNFNEPAPGARASPRSTTAAPTGSCSVTGGYIVRDRGGCRRSTAATSYGRLLPRAAVPRDAAGQWREQAPGPLNLKRIPNLSSFGEDARGRVYATLAGRHGLPLRAVRLDVVAGRLAVCRLDGAEPVPAWALGAARRRRRSPATAGELSVICPEDAVAGRPSRAATAGAALAVRGPPGLRADRRPGRSWRPRSPTRRCRSSPCRPYDTDLVLVARGRPRPRRRRAARRRATRWPHEPRGPRRPAWIRADKPGPR